MGWLQNTLRDYVADITGEDGASAHDHHAQRPAAPPNGARPPQRPTVDYLTAMERRPRQRARTLSGLPRLDATIPDDYVIASGNTPDVLFRDVRTSLGTQRPWTIPLGMRHGSWITSRPQHHVLAIAPPRAEAGKTASLIIPATLAHPNPVVTASTKADILTATAMARAQYGKLWCYAPCGSDDIPAGVTELRWSPIAGAQDWDVAVATAVAMTAALDTGSVRNGDHWRDRAADLLAAIFHWAALTGATMRDARNAVYEHTTQLTRIAEQLGNARAPDAARALTSVRDASREEARGIASTAARALKGYRTDAALRSTEDAEFDIADFVNGGPHGLRADTIYITAPSDQQELVAPLVVGFLDQIQRAVYKRHRRLEAAGLLEQAGAAPILFALDELYGLAPLPNLPHILSEGGSQGLLIAAAVQDLSLIKSRWKDEADAFMTMFGHVLVYPGIRDVNTLEDISTLVGMYDHGKRELNVKNNIDPAYLKSLGNFRGVPNSAPRIDQEESARLSVDRRLRLEPHQVMRGVDPRNPDLLLHFNGAADETLMATPYFRSAPWPMLLTAYLERALSGCAPEWRCWESVQSGERVECEDTLAHLPVPRLTTWKDRAFSKPNEEHPCDLAWAARYVAALQHREAVLDGAARLARPMPSRPLSPDQRWIVTDLAAHLPTTAPPSPRPGRSARTPDVTVSESPARPPAAPPCPDDDEPDRGGGGSPTGPPSPEDDGSGGLADATVSESPARPPAAPPCPDDDEPDRGGGGSPNGPPSPEDDGSGGLADATVSESEDDLAAPAADDVPPTPPTPPTPPSHGDDGPDPGPEPDDDDGADDPAPIYTDDVPDSGPEPHSDDAPPSDTGRAEGEDPAPETAAGSESATPPAAGTPAPDDTRLYFTPRGEPAEVTDEDLRLLASGAWTPTAAQLADVWGSYRVGLPDDNSLMSDFEARNWRRAEVAAAKPEEARSADDTGKIAWAVLHHPSLEPGTPLWVRNLATTETIRRHTSGESASVTEFEQARRHALDATYAEGSPAWRDQKMRTAVLQRRAQSPATHWACVPPRARRLIVAFILRRDLEAYGQPQRDDDGRLARIAPHVEALEAEAVRVSVPVPVARFDFDTPWGPEDEQAMRVRVDGDPVPERFEEIVEAFHTAGQAERDRRLSLGDSASVRRYRRAREKLVHDLETQPSLRDRGEWESAAAVEAGQDGGCGGTGWQPTSSASTRRTSSATPSTASRRKLGEQPTSEDTAPLVDEATPASDDAISSKSTPPDPIPEVTPADPERQAESASEDPEDVPRPECWEPQWTAADDEAVREWGGSGEEPECFRRTHDEMQAAIEREKDRRHVIGDARSIWIFEEQRAQLLDRKKNPWPDIAEILQRDVIGFWALLPAALEEVTMAFLQGEDLKLAYGQGPTPPPPAQAADDDTTEE